MSVQAFCLVRSLSAVRVDALECAARAVETAGRFAVAFDFLEAAGVAGWVVGGVSCVVVATKFSSGGSGGLVTIAVAKG